VRLTWWQWILAAVAVVLGLVGLAWGVGMTLPEAHTATASVPVDAPPDSVWTLITDVEGYPGWRPEVRSVTVLGGEAPGPVWREETDMGTLTFRTVSWDPPHSFTARIADEGLPFGGSWAYEVIADGAGARLFITEDGQVYHPLFRFMSRFVFGHEGTIRAYLDAVQAELGGG
jgi:uncharacterized protein YndB with AHSA1/START domain